MKKTSFMNGNVNIAANIHVPADFDPTAKYPALVCVHPGSSVKEQTSGLYSAKMAEKGYVAVAFDASHQGESGGEPRNLEDPYLRVEDIRCAVDFLTTLDYVDPERIGILGVCAGGGYTVNAAMTEHRIKAVGAVVPINIGRAYRAGDGSEGAAIKTLEAVGAQRTSEAGGADFLNINWLPDTVEQADEVGITGGDTRDAVEYYRTPRAFCKTATNRLLFRSIDKILSFDAFNLVDELLTQPIQIIIGNRVGEFGSFKEGNNLFAKITSEKDLMVVDGASHYDLYDKPECVDQAVEKLTAFYGKNL